MSNCRPGDLAVIIKTHPETEQCLGRPVRLGTMVLIEGETCWTYEGMPLKGRHPSAGSWMWKELPDDWLRPIRPQADTAQDESLSWRAVPLLSPKQGEPA